MKFIQYISLFLLTILCSTSYADENGYVFVGQNENTGKAVFVLELLQDDVKVIQTNENGEVCLKVDKIVSLSKDALSSLGYPSTEEAIHSLLAMHPSDFEETILQCGGRVSLPPPSPKQWKCPYCSLYWNYGERCGNDKCATNQWKKTEDISPSTNGEKKETSDTTKTSR